MTRKHIIYILILYSVLFLGCLFLIKVTEESVDNGEVCPAKKIAVVDGHAIIESSDSQGNYTKVYLDKIEVKYFEGILSEERYHCPSHLVLPYNCGYNYSELQYKK